MKKTLQGMQTLYLGAKGEDGEGFPEQEQKSEASS